MGWITLMSLHWGTDCYWSNHVIERLVKLEEANLTCSFMLVAKCLINMPIDRYDTDWYNSSNSLNVNFDVCVIAKSWEVIQICNDRIRSRFDSSRVYWIHWRRKPWYQGMFQGHELLSELLEIMEQPDEMDFCISQILQSRDRSSFILYILAMSSNLDQQQTGSMLDMIWRRSKTFDDYYREREIQSVWTHTGNSCCTN